MSRNLIAVRCIACQREFTHRGGDGVRPVCPSCGEHERLHWLEWYVVQTNHKAEAVADRRLRGRGYETFFPRYKTLVSHARKVVEVVRPYLPSYLFVGLAPRQGLYGVNTAQGVATVLHSGGRPQRLPDSIVTEWRDRMGEAGLIEVPSVHDAKRAKLESGQEVRIVEGPFAGFDGIVALDNGREVTVWTSLFGRRVKAQFHIGALSPVLRSLPK